MFLVGLHLTFLLAHWDLDGPRGFFSGSTQSVFHMKHLLGFSAARQVESDLQWESP